MAHNIAHGSLDQYHLTYVHSMQRLTGFMRAVNFIAIGSLISMMCILRYQPDYLYLNRAYVIVSNAITATLLLILAVIAGRAAYRTSVALRLGKTWTPLRRRSLAAVALKAGVMLLILATNLARSAAVLGHPEWFCRVPLGLSLLSFLHWMGWNVMLLLLLFDGREASMPAARTRQSCRARASRIWILTWIVINFATTTGAFRYSLSSIARRSSAACLS